MKAIFLSLIAVLIVTTANPVAADSKKEKGTYQIVKATENRLWRLNTRTGEISVCLLDGEQLVCTSSANAIEVPKQTYEERLAEKKRQTEEQNMRREEQRRKDLAFLDRVIEAVRSLVNASMEKEATK